MMQNFRKRFDQVNQDSTSSVVFWKCDNIFDFLVSTLMHTFQDIIVFSMERIR
jgi:hypothetical protein